MLKTCMFGEQRDSEAIKHLSLRIELLIVQESVKARHMN